MNHLEEQIFDIIAQPHLAGLATVTEEGKPWVRYVMAQGTEDFTIRFSSFADSRKVRQMKSNPEVHLNCGVTGLTDLQPYLQIQGKAEVVTTQVEKEKFWNEQLEKVFKGPDDPNYVVVIVKPYRIEYEMPGKIGAPEVWIKE